MLSLSLKTNGVSVAQPVVSLFTVKASAPPAQHGYVRVAADRRYFETSDGRPLRLIGQNLCWAEAGGTFDYDRWFAGMKSGGENFARLWLAPGLCRSNICRAR